MENMKIYEAVRKVPDSAKKNIRGGRLKGMTDINPMWRIKALTEQFGPCGIGWKLEVSRTWQDLGADGVCCKMLGFGAYGYWAADRTKYQQVQPQDTKKEQARQQAAEKISPDQVAVLKDNAQNERVKKALAYYKVSRIEDLTRQQADKIFMKLGL